MSKDYELQNVNKKMVQFIKTEPKYRGLSFNKATGKLVEDILKLKGILR
jgi:hypothetical protein